MYTHIVLYIYTHSTAIVYTIYNRTKTRKRHVHNTTFHTREHRHRRHRRVTGREMLLGIEMIRTSMAEKWKAV